MSKLLQNPAHGSLLTSHQIDVLICRQMFWVFALFPLITELILDISI